MEYEQSYIPPKFQQSAFHCPICNVYANQTWCRAQYIENVRQRTGQIEKLEVARCSHCSEFSFWINGQLSFPQMILSPPAQKDMPESVREFYDEARQISAFSSRAAAALLRIAAKKLCEHLGETESNLNRAIGNLQKKGLPDAVIKSLDTVRIVGNEGGAHEGQIDLTDQDSKEIVSKLFLLINFIVEKTITEPINVENMFAAMPEDKRQGVENRDKEKQ